MNERLKQLRKALGLTLEKFGERLGVTKTTISRLENGERNITEQMFTSICREFNVTPEWLRSGQGEIFHKIPNSIMEQLRQEFQLDSFSYNLVYEYLKLSVEKRSIVRELFYNIMSKEININSLPNNNRVEYSSVHNNPEEYEKDELNKSTAELEAEYKKNLSSYAKSEDFTVLNTTDEDEKKGNSNVVNK